jgi:hypothetical protein
MARAGLMDSNAIATMAGLGVEIPLTTAAVAAHRDGDEPARTRPRALPGSKR